MAAEPFPLIPQGRYHVAYVKCEKGKPFGIPRLFVHFKITEPGPHFGFTLLRYYNAPKGQFLPRTHNLWRDYVTLTKRRPPARGLTPGAFLGNCEVLVEVVTVKHQIEGRRRIELPADCHYSKIDRLIRITSGCPPCLQRR